MGSALQANQRPSSAGAGTVPSRFFSSMEVQHGSDSTFLQLWVGWL